MLPGLVGGAQYEVLLKLPGNGLRWSTSFSFADLLMVALIALANIGYFASKRRIVQGMSSITAILAIPF